MQQYLIYIADCFRKDTNFWITGLPTIFWNCHGYQLRPIVSKTIFIFIWSRICTREEEITCCVLQLEICVNRYTPVNSPYSTFYQDTIPRTKSDSYWKKSLIFQMLFTYKNKLQLIFKNQHLFVNFEETFLVIAIIQRFRNIFFMATEKNIIHTKWNKTQLFSKCLFTHAT